jgi:hypothetical protein
MVFASSSRLTSPGRLGQFNPFQWRKQTWSPHCSPPPSHSLLQRKLRRAAAGTLHTSCSALKCAPPANCSATRALSIACRCWPTRKRSTLKQLSFARTAPSAASWRRVCRRGKAPSQGPPANAARSVASGVRKLVSGIPTTRKWRPAPKPVANARRRAATWRRWSAVRADRIIFRLYRFRARSTETRSSPSDGLLSLSSLPFVRVTVYCPSLTADSVERRTHRIWLSPPLRIPHSRRTGDGRLVLF